MISACLNEGDELVDEIVRKDFIHKYYKTYQNIIYAGNISYDYSYLHVYN